jgi:flagellar basal body rod protein FlgB
VHDRRLVQPARLFGRKKAARCHRPAPKRHRQQYRQSRNARLQTPGCRPGPQQIAALQPQLAVDATAPTVSPDGNTVNLESELLAMNKNSLANTLQTQLITTDFYRLRMAITGKS